MKTKGIIPPQYTKQQWENMRHDNRIKALYEFSNSSGLTAQALMDIKNEIVYYKNIRNQINILTL